MKPSQFLYSENVKEQKGQKSIITKSQAELRPLVKPASQPKDQNASMIYSLVTLPVKDGKKEEIVFPESLISQHLKLDKEKIVGKNTELARKLKKLKPLDNDLSSSISTPDQEKVKPKNEQLQGPRLQVYIKALNDITGGQFKKTQSHLLFGSIEQKIQKSNVLCLVKFKSLKFFNQYDLTNDKIPGLFCWEVKHKGKSLVKTTPKEYEKVQQDLLDFTFKRHSYESPQVILWKIKNNDEKYLGQFNLDNSDFVNLTEILDYKGKKIVESTTEKEMFRTMKQTKSYLGNVEFQIIQLGNEQLPQNKHSGIPGSPRTDEEKLRHRLIDLVMSGAQYRWRFDENERLIIEEIQQASQELVAEYIIEQVVDASGKMGDIMITKFINYADKGRGLDQRLQDMLNDPNQKEAAKGFYRLQKRYKKEEFDQVIAILSQLDQNGQLKSIKKYVRTNLKGRKLNFATAEAALLSAGVQQEVIADLLKNDLGLNMFDFFLSSTGLVFDDIVKDLKFDENTSYIMSESKTPPDAAKGSYRIMGRTYRKEHFDQVMNTLAELNSNGSLVEVKEELQRMGLKGRVTRKDIENTLAKAGVNANQLIILTTNDLGLNLLDMFLSSDQLANALIAFQQVNLVEENELNLESISENLFKIIGKKVRRNHQLTAVKEFILSLEKKPELARLFYNYSYAPENYVNDIPPFIQNFNLKNYEHIYILGRLLKLFEKWEVKTPFYEALKQYHVEAKKSIYFEIPCFPKDMDLEDKKASLTLGDLQQNILHEVARRQKWEKLYKAFEKFSKWAFEKDFRGESAFQQMLEKASYDVIKLFFTNYPEQLAERFAELEIVPTLVANPRKAFEYHFDEEKQKNYLHSLIENPNLSQQELLESLQLVEALVNQSGAKNFNTLKKQKVQSEFTPLLYFLGYLEERSRKKADRVQREIGSSLFIIQLLQVEDDDPEDNNNDPQTGDAGDGGDDKNKKKPQQNELLFKILSKFPETIFEKLDDSFKNLDWLTKINNFYQFHYLVKHKQQKKLIQLISQMAQDINKFQYDSSKFRDEEYQPNKDIITYIKFMVAILLEIKALKNRSLDQISQQIIFLLRFWIKKYIELLPSYATFDEFPHLLRKFKYKNTNTQSLIELFFNFQYLTVFQELQSVDIQRIDIDYLVMPLNNIQNSEGLKLFILPIIENLSDIIVFEAIIQSGLFEYATTQLIKDSYFVGYSKGSEGNEDNHRLQFEDSKNKLFVYLSKNQQLVKPEIYFIFDDISESTAKLILDQKISDQFLKLIQKLPKYEEHLRQYNAEVYKKLIAGQNIDIPLTQLIQLNLTQGVNIGRIESFLKRSQNPKHQALHYLFDKDFIATSNTPKFNQSLKELIKTIDVKKSFYQIVNNAQYDKIDAFIGATNAAQQKLDLDTIREAITQVAELGYLQITDFPSYLSAVKGKKSDFYISPFDPGAFVKIVGRGQDAIPKIPQDKTDLQILFDETIANPYIYSVSRVSYQKKKIQQIKFPENLNKIRVPMSTFHQLIEMNPGLEEEIKQAWDQGWNKNKRLHQERIEEHLQKDIWLFKYTKHLRYTFLSQNIKSVFFKMESFISSPQSYRKTFDQLLKIYNKAGIAFSQDAEVVRKVIVTGILFNQFQMDTILQLLAPFKVQDFIIVDIVDKIYGLTKKTKNQNQFQKQIQAKNLQNYITFTQKLLKNVNIKKFLSDEEKITQIQELFGSIRTSFKERRTDQVEFKYAYELFSLIIQFDEKELDKFQIKDTLVDIARYLQKKKPSEKLTLQLIKKFDLKPYSQDYNKILEDKIASAKKSTIQDFFTNNLFKTLMGKFGDEKVLRILKELFKQKLNKDSKEFLLEHLYNIELFKTVFFYRATKTYNFLINEVLHKQVFNSNTMMTKQILQAIIDKGQVDWMTENKIKESNEEATSALEAAVQEFDDLAIQQSQSNEAEAEQEDDVEKDNDGGDVMIESINAQDAPKQQKKPKQSTKNQPKTNYLFQASYFKKRLAVILEETKHSIYKQILLRKELENLYNKIDVKKSIIKRKDDPDYKPGQSPLDKKQNKNVTGDENQEKEEEIEQLSNDEQTLLVVQAQVLNFYEFFETINKFQLQSHFTQETTVNIVSRFKLLTDDQLQQHIKSFEELGYEYIVKALKVQRYFQINWNSLDSSFESALFIIPLMSQRLITPNNLYTRFRSQQELLKIISGSRSKPQIFDQIFEQIRDQYVTIDISNNFNAIQIKQFGFDRGIKIAKRISDEDPEEYFPNIRKMKAVKPWIGIDAFLENSQNYKQQVLILNDNNFKQVIDPYFNNINIIQEFCVDPEDIFDIINRERTDKSLVPHIYPLLVNFPQILFFQGYKERWLGSYSLFYHIELSLVIVKSILVNEPNLINDYIDLLLRILADLYKSEETEENQQQQVEQEQPVEDEYIDEEYESEEEVDATESEEDAPVIQQQVVQQPAAEAVKPKNNLSIASNRISVQQADDKQEDDNVEVVQAEDDDLDARPKKQQEPDSKDQVQSDRYEAPEVKQVQQDKPKKKKIVKVKKTRKVLKPKPQKQEAPFKSEFLDELTNSSCSLIHANIFIQFLLIAISNDKALHSLQNQFIEYKLIKAPDATKQYDKVVTDRLIAAGYKGPFDIKFVNMMESKQKELKQPILDDVKHIKKILIENENQEAKRFRNLFQVIISQVLKADCNLDTFITTISQSHPYRLLSQKKANVFQVPLDKDDKFQIEIRQNFDNLDISRDFLDKYFENISSHTSLDKWIQTLYLFRYLRMAKNQIERIEHLKFEFNYAAHEILYRFVFKNSKSFDNLVYQVEKVNPGDFIVDSENQYLFKFHIDIIINLAKTQNYPVPYINSKYEEEIQKLFDAYNIEQFKQELDENGPFLKKISRVIAQGQQINYDALFKQINQENFRKIKTLITEQYLFLQNEQFENEWGTYAMKLHDRECKINWKNQLYEKQFKEGLDLITKYVSDNPTIDDYLLFADRIPILRLRDALRQGQQVDYTNNAIIEGQEYQLYNDRVRPDLKIKIQDKLYPLPYSNYQLRQRNATYKVSVGSDLCFPEFYPFLRLHRYVMIPELVSKKQYYEKFDTVIALQQTCNDLNSYSSLFQEFSEQLPELDEDGFFLLPNQQQNVSWPILVAENGYYSASQDSHPLYLTQYLHQKLQLRVDNLTNNYKYNVLSLTEIILNKITRVVQATTNKKCKIQTAVNIFEDWTFFRKVITRIDQILTSNDLNVFKFYYVEVNEAHPNSTHQLRPKQEGLDAVFRFGPTNFYVHSNVLIIRLNLALVSENGQSIVNAKSLKQRIRDSTDPTVYDQDIANYLNAIVNYDDLLKQLFAKK